MKLFLFFWFVVGVQFLGFLGASCEIFYLFCLYFWQFSAFLLEVGILCGRISTS